MSGKMEVWLLDLGTLYAKQEGIICRGWPQDTSRIHLPVMAVLVRHSGGILLFDTGCRPDAMTGGWPANMREAFPLTRTSEQALTHQLSLCGISPLSGGYRRVIPPASGPRRKCGAFSPCPAYRSSRRLRICPPTDRKRRSRPPGWLYSGGHSGTARENDSAGAGSAAFSRHSAAWAAGTYAGTVRYGNRRQRKNPIIPFGRGVYCRKLWPAAGFSPKPL